MKRVQISESQYSRLFEDSGSIPMLDDGDIREYPGSEISTTAVVTSSDGEPEYGKQPVGDELGQTLTPQQWGARGGRRGGWAV